MILPDSVASLHGISATGLVERMPVLLPEVVRFTFARYTPSLGVDQRITGCATTSMHSELDRLRSAFPLLFERVTGLSALIAMSDQESETTIAQMMRHNDSDESTHEFTLTARELSTQDLTFALSTLLPGQALGLSSICLLPNGKAHLPVLDFHLPISPRNQELVEQAARQLGLTHAAILESGRSYHLYGLCTLTQNDWFRLMLRAILLAPITDARYIAHRLLAGRGVLRINSTHAKPIEPRVVAAF